MISPLELLYAFLLDIAIGDPRWLPHPVRIMGRAITFLERFLRRIFTSAPGERLGGIFLVLGLTLPVYLLTDLAVEAAHRTGTHYCLPGMVFIVYLTSTTIAARELIRSAELVIQSVRSGDIFSARLHVGMIVGRDTDKLSDKGVLKATIETLAENLSDGVIAPLLYLALGGLPLAMTYKAVNTLDSMVGYKNDRYRDFGWAAARLDDVANYLPARITGCIIVLSVFLVRLVESGGKSFAVARRSCAIMFRDGRNHPSPNSGVPEAAMAGALGVRLGGPSTYAGVLSDKPYIGEEEMDDYLAAAYDATAVVKISFAIAGLVVILISGLRTLQ